MSASEGKLAYDVLISGGGPVGLTLACLLKKECPHIEVAVFDPLLLTSAKSDKRTIAMSSATQWVYQQIGIWEQLARRSGRLDTVLISDQGHAGKTRLTKADNKGEPLGYVVDQAELKNALQSELKSLNVILESRAIDCCKVTASGVVVTSEKGNIQADLLVVAEGASSPTRNQLGISHTVHDYDQRAFVARVDHEKPHAHLALERFTRRGPGALLPLANPKQSAVVVCLDKEGQSNFNANDRSAFLAYLDQLFGFVHGRFTASDEPLSFPLQLTQAEEQVRRGIVLVGNAWRSLHPVAGQGYNLAIRTCLELCSALASNGAYHAYSDARLGDLARLEHFAEKVASDQSLTTTFSHGLDSLFRQKGVTSALARTMGLNLMDSLGPLREPVFAQVMGRGRALPELRLLGNQV